MHMKRAKVGTLMLVSGRSPILKDFGHTPRKSEADYVWKVPLMGEDQILLTEKESEGYWEPGIFSTTVPCGPLLKELLIGMIAPRDN